MRKILLAAVTATLALALAPASAAPGDPACVIAGGGLGDDGTVADTCVFTADAGPHGYSVNTPNDVLIYQDGNGNGVYDSAAGSPDTLYAEVAPTEFEPIVGTLDIPEGTDVTVQVKNGCAGPACGWFGTIVVK